MAAILWLWFFRDQDMNWLFGSVALLYTVLLAYELRRWWRRRNLCPTCRQPKDAPSQQVQWRVGAAAVPCWNKFHGKKAWNYGVPK